MLPMLLIESKQPGLLYVNGQFCGKLDGQQTFIAHQDDRVYLELRPFDTRCAGVVSEIVLSGGMVKPPESGVFVVEWPEGIKQIELHPAKTAQSAPMELLSQLKAKELSLMVMRVGDRTAIAREGQVLFDVPQDAQEVQLRDFGDGMMVISLRDGDMSCLYLTDGTRLIGSLRAKKIAWESQRRISALESLNDTVGHGTLTLYSITEAGLTPLERQSVWADGAPHWPQTPQDTLLAYLEAVHMGAQDEAAQYAAHSGVRPPSAFDGVVPLRYSLKNPPQGLPVQVGMLRVQGPTLAQVSAIGARLRESRHAQGLYKIDALSLL